MKDPRKMLAYLGAYRVLQHFNGDWQAAEAYAIEHVGEQWTIRGEKAWREAEAKVLEQMHSSEAAIVRLRLEKAKRTAEWRKHFPNKRDEDAPWLSLTPAQKAYLTKILPHLKELKPSL